MEVDITQEIKPQDDAPKNGGSSYAFFTLILFVCLLGVTFWWMQWGRYSVSTDDAHVSGNKIEVASQVAGRVLAIYTDDTQVVTQGQILLSLDPTESVIAFEKSKSALAETVRAVAALFQQPLEVAAEIERQKALFESSLVEYESRKILSEIGGVSREEFIHAKAQMEASAATIDLLNYRLSQALARTAGSTITTHPMVLSGASALKSAALAVARCTLRAPVSGVIAMREVQVGERILPGRTLLSLVPIDSFWVEANFKETQLRQISPGQSVTLKSDVYGSGVKFEGKVVGIGGGTGSVFSLLPPQNASGNWIKIVQRVPVRIALDQEQISAYPLRLGLSMDVAVDIRTTGRSSSKPTKTLFATEPEWTEKEQAGIDELISAIIQENLQ